MTYGNAEGFQEYHEQRGRDIPGTWSEETVNAALLVASEWVDAVYGPSFVGYKTDGFEQAREWPRMAAVTNTFPSYTFPTDEIPERVIHATYEAAWREATVSGSLNKDFTPGKYKSVAISGAVSVDYAQFSSNADIQTQITVVDRLLVPLIDPRAGASYSTLTGGIERV